jgi:hypothetical protein
LATFSLPRQSTTTPGGAANGEAAWQAFEKRDCEVLKPVMFKLKSD